MEVTAREIDTTLKAGSKYKKPVYYPDYDYPLVPITANTYLTGKHGSAKTRMMVKDWFTDASFSLILDSSTLFNTIDDSPDYSTGSGFVDRIENSTAFVINEDYEEIPMVCTKDTNVGDNVTYTRFRDKYKLS